MKRALLVLSLLAGAALVAAVLALKAGYGGAFGLVLVVALAVVTVTSFGLYLAGGLVMYGLLRLALWRMARARGL